MLFWCRVLPAVACRMSGREHGSRAAVPGFAVTQAEATGGGDLPMSRSTSPTIAPQRLKKTLAKRRHFTLQKGCVDCRRSKISSMIRRAKAAVR